ncbi:CDP-alcohol phosphatidyltransferase family protein [Mesonia maritima]|uniref:CDP-diacylglycerol--serine O-phosphatidyltransferase n=1 Tax=Mesonia maritima TaxID=1793873 RepID=A0ABU1K5G0_9FLAO|nr:CDP-alcohol phosphatidyltransferase family protein [Mesonia maritima]MDR6300475.1 CDP-diacylglycerol--serine O-phosphatidyltransferase [Mesonia maritima]
MLKKHIPNIITLLNLLCGSIGVILAVQNNLITAALFVGLGIFFDFFDGLAARSLDVQSEIGLQLDSLADMVTSGLVPGIVMFQLLNNAIEYQPETAVVDWSATNYLSFDMPILPLLGLLISLGSGYRLAKFNVDERQTDSFIGLPTPANAILILSLPLILAFQPHPFAVELILNQWVLIGLTIFSAIILNAELPLFALKFKTWGVKENWFRYGFLLLALILLVTLQYLALPILIISYVLLSIILSGKNKKA